MSPLGTLYTYPNNPRAFKALIAAKYNKVEIKLGDFAFGTTNKEKSFLDKFPFGKVPAFESTDGACIAESNAIAHFVAKSGKTTLFGDGSATHEALVQQYINIADNEITPAAATWIYPILGFIPYNEANTKKAQEDIKKTLTTLNKILSTRTYLVGEAITLADIHVTIALLFLFKLVLDVAHRQQFVHVTRYFLTCVNQPEFKDVIGEVALCEKTAVYDPKNIPKPAAQPKKEEKKAEKPAEKPVEKKVEKPAEKPVEAEEEPEESFEEPKKKNPLDSLPPSKFSLETWKRIYSNSSEADAVKYFWENIDLEGHSIWFCKYKYNEENKKVFMTCNLLGGFFQRLEEVRKYAFGSFVVSGVDDDNEVTGYWVFRGQDIPAEVLDCPDYESYDFTKITDIATNEEKKKDFNAYLAWSNIDGVAQFTSTAKPFNQGKNFK